MTKYEFETNSVVSGCNIYNDGSRTFIKDAVSPGAYVEVTLTGITEGWYDLSINYAQGLGESVSPWKVLVNSDEEYPIFLKNTLGWWNWQTTFAEKIYLTNGTNVIRFTQYGAPADLDYFNLTYSTLQTKIMPERLLYWTETGEILTTPARQPKYLDDSVFTTNNYDLSVIDSNRCLICENTAASTITLPDINWEINEPYAEIEIVQTGANLQLIVGSGLTSIGTTTFNITSSGSIVILKHLKDKSWLIKGDLA